MQSEKLLISYVSPVKVGQWSYISYLGELALSGYRELSLIIWGWLDDGCNMVKLGECKYLDYFSLVYEG